MVLLRTGFTGISSDHPVKTMVGQNPDVLTSDSKQIDREGFQRSLTPERWEDDSAPGQVGKTLHVVASDKEGAALSGGESRGRRVSPTDGRCFGGRQCWGLCSALCWVQIPGCSPRVWRSPLIGEGIWGDPIGDCLVTCDQQRSGFAPGF